MKILVIQQKMIGDVLTSSILFEALRSRFPQAELHYMIQPHTSAVVENNPFIDKLILFEPKENGSLRGFVNFIRVVKKEGYDLVIDVYSKIGTAVLSWFSGASGRISYHKWYTSLAYSHCVERKAEPATEAGLAIEHRMALLQPLEALFPQVLKPKIYLSPQENENAHIKLHKAGVSIEKPLVMTNILGSSPVKTYPIAYMSRLLDFIAAQDQAQILFNYIPSQRDLARQVYESCLPATRQQIFYDITGNSLREFMAITAQCNALIGNEGGAINMAKALNVPTFAIFSPQIQKKAWSLFEDGRQNVSVHLSEFQQERFKNKSEGHLKKNSHSYYKDFKPEFFFPQLQAFLDLH